MVGVLATGLIWAVSGVITGGFTLFYAGRQVLDKVDSHSRYLNDKHKNVADAKVKRFKERQAKEVLNVGLLDTEGNVPQSIQALREWALNELSRMTADEKHTLIVSTGLMQLGSVPELQLRLKSGKSYYYGEWIALCTYVGSTEAQEVERKQEKLKPAEVDPFFDTRRE